MSLVMIDDGCDGCGAVDVAGVCMPEGKRPRPVLCADCIVDLAGGLRYLARANHLFTASKERAGRKKGPPPEAA